jgi:serine/threonine protein kinase
MSGQRKAWEFVREADRKINNGKRIIIMETRDALQVGTVLKSPEYAYTIKSVLGQGSFGITYLASTKMMVHGPLGDIETEAKVAIKEFYMQGLNSRCSDRSVGGSSGSSLVTNYRKEFRREAEKLSKMHHENIVKVLDVFDANGTTYYVMQHIEGMSLDEYIISHGHFAEKEASEYLATIARALGYMHSQKMLHLDLKPKNIMRQNDGKLFLMGFGLSKHYDSNGEPESSISVGLGTPGYAPLEQDDIDDSKTIAATLDIYALGATYYKMLTGQTPPNALNVLNDQGKKLKETLAGSSDKAIPLALRMMSPLKGSRPQNVEGVLALLERDVIKGGENKRIGKQEDGKKEVDEMHRNLLEVGKGAEDRTQLTKTERNRKTEAEHFWKTETERIMKIEEERKKKEEDERKAAEEQKRKRKRLILLIGSCVALLAIIGGVICYVVSSKDNQPVKRASGEKIRANSSVPVAVDLGLSVKWASCNVGASKPEEYGGYYGWADPTGTKTSTNDDEYPSANPPSEISGTEYDIARAKWGGSWRLPTKAEQQELIDSCTWTWTTYNGVKGMKVTGHNGNSIFLPVAGYRHGTDMGKVGSDGSCWSGTLRGRNAEGAFHLHFSDDCHHVGGDDRNYGCSVRPVVE